MQQKKKYPISTKLSFSCYFIHHMIK